MSHLIDADWLVDLLNNRPEAASVINPLIQQGTAISAVTLAELAQGVFYGRNPARDRQALQRLLVSIRVLPFDEPVAYQFAMLRGAFRQQGRPMPVTDLIIASTALVHHLTLITRNRKHFERVPGLILGPAVGDT